MPYFLLLASVLSGISAERAQIPVCAARSDILSTCQTSGGRATPTQPLQQYPVAAC